MSFTITKQCTGFLTGDIITSSTCGHTATIAEPLVLYFQPLRRVTCDRTGNAELGAFAFQGRCFGRDEACCGSARFRVERIASSVATCLIGAARVHGQPPYTAGCVRGLAGSTPAVPTKASSSPKRTIDAKYVAECRRSPSQKRCAVTTSPARELAGGISRTALYGDDGLAPRNGARWKSKPDLMGAVVLTRMAESGNITRWACPMSQAISQYLNNRRKANHA